MAIVPCVSRCSKRAKRTPTALKQRCQVRGTEFLLRCHFVTSLMIVSSSRWNSKRAAARNVRRRFRLHSRRHADPLLHHRRRPHLFPIVQSSIVVTLFCSLLCSRRFGIIFLWWASHSQKFRHITVSRYEAFPCPAVRGGMTNWKDRSSSRCMLNPGRVLGANLGPGGDSEVSHNTTA